MLTQLELGEGAMGRLHLCSKDDSPHDYTLQYPLLSIWPEPPTVGPLVVLRSRSTVHALCA